MKSSVLLAGAASLVIASFAISGSADARERHRDRDDYRYSGQHYGGGHYSDRKHHRKKKHRRKHHRKKHRSSHYSVGFSYGYPSYGYGYNYGYGYPNYYVNYNYGYYGGYHRRGHYHNNGAAYAALGVGIGYLLSEATRPKEREVVYVPTEPRYSEDRSRERPRESRPQPAQNRYDPAAEFPNGCVQTREYTTTITIGGEEKDAYGTACLQADGSWLTGAPKVVPEF